MSSRVFKSKSRTLIDLARPENKLLDVRAIDGGFRFRFSGRVLPEWFKEMAKMVEIWSASRN